MINPIRETEQKIFQTQEASKIICEQTPSTEENGVDKSTPKDTYVQGTSEIIKNYDVDKYVQILKNMVVPPSDRFDASILLSLEMNGKITPQDVRDMIQEVTKKNIRKVHDKDSAKVQATNTDANSGKEA